MSECKMVKSRLHDIERLSWNSKLSGGKERIYKHLNSHSHGAIIYITDP